jgi:hypothetical protein
LQIIGKELTKKKYNKRKVKHSTECNYVPVEHGCDAGLRDGDGLLLHGFVYRHPVLVPHLIELKGGRIERLGVVRSGKNE